MKAHTRRWAIAIGASLGIHAAAFTAIRAVVLTSPPVLHLPAGSAEGAVISLSPIPDPTAIAVDASATDDAAEREMSRHAEPVVDEIAPVIAESKEAESTTWSRSLWSDSMLRQPVEDDPEVKPSTPSAPPTPASAPLTRDPEPSHLVEIARDASAQVARAAGDLAKRMKSLFASVSEEATAVVGQLAAAMPASQSSGGAAEGGEAPGESTSGSANEPSGGSSPGVAHSPTASRGNRPPAYPREALERRLEGTVLLRLVIEPDGDVSDATVVRSSGVESLDRSALEAAVKWRFTPAMENGAAVRCEVTVPVEFKLNSRSGGK